MKTRTYNICFATCMLLATTTTSHAATVYLTKLSGDAEVPAIASDAMGKFKLVRHGRALRYELDVGKIQDIVAAHIHCGVKGENGPPGITLFSIDASAAYKIEGRLAQGPIFTPLAENPCGWATARDVAKAIKNGNAYVNVHTLGNPAGEIRGQIKKRNSD